MEIMETYITLKNANKLYCKKCDFNCSKPCDWKRHLMTTKHNKEINGKDGNEKNADVYECSNCNKEFKTNSGLWKHKNKCSINQDKKKEHTKTEIPTQNTDIDKELLLKMLLKNQDVMEGVLLKNQDVMDKLMEIMPLIGNQINNNTNTNSHNTTNNQFNIQMFLNEHCKDAMNLTDFIDSLPITAETYDHTIENGLTKSITKMMVTGLSEMDILQRPIHCTDASRKTLYVKDNDIWEKDNELLHMLKGISELSLKQRVNIHKWQDENEGWDVKDDLQTKITMLVFHTMTDLDNDVKETRKIISAISKNTYLTNEIKSQYLS